MEGPEPWHSRFQYLGQWSRRGLNSKEAGGARRGTLGVHSGHLLLILLYFRLLIPILLSNHILKLVLILLPILLLILLLVLLLILIFVFLFTLLLILLPIRATASSTFATQSPPISSTVPSPAQPCAAPPALHRP